MTSKQRVTFRFSGTGPGSGSGYGSDLPNLAVEVYDGASALAGRGTLRGGVELEPGRDYFISATLADGTRVTTHTKLEPSTTEVVLSEPVPVACQMADQPAPTQPGEASDVADVAIPAAGAAVQDSGEEWPSRKATPRATKKGKTVTAPWRVSGFRGNLLTSPPAAFALERIETTAPPPGTAGTPPAQPLDSWSVEFQGTGPTYVQLVQSERPVWNYAVPLDPGERCTIRLVRVGAELAIDMTLPNSNADLLLRYVGNNLLQEASQTAESPTILAQDLLSGKFEFPIGAAIGFYFLLRRGELERLHDWTTTLYHSSPWLPDGVVILAEHLARLGEHKKALATLVELPKRGLPFFSSGLTYALNRLRQYKRAVEKGDLAGDIKPLNALGAALGRYAGYIDVTRPILTFMGTNPLRPSHRAGARSLPRRSINPP